MAEKKELAVMLKEHQSELRQLAPKYLNTNRMMAIFIEAARNPKLRECNPISVLASAKKMAELGTEIVGSGGVHLVPFGREMTVIPDWRLIVSKAVSAGVIKHATATVVHSGDEFDYEYGLEPRLVHKPARKEKAPMSDVYCVYTLPDGEKQFLVMSKTDVDFIRSKSKAGKSGPWVDFYEEMAKKTVIRRALKVFEGASLELSKVIDQDNAAVGLVEFDYGEPIAEPKAIDTTAETSEEFDPGEPPEETKEPETDKEKQEQIFNWCLEMADGKPEEAEKKIEVLSAFVKKDKETKKVIENVPGIKNPYDLKGGRLKVTFERVKKAYDGWKEGK
jgi:recombination protein RecT